MNRKQIEYMRSALIHQYAHVILPAFAALNFGAVLMDINNPCLATFQGITSAVLGYMAVNALKENAKLQQIRRISTNSRFACVLVEQTGLERLLERTRAREKLEWGTVFRVSGGRHQSVIIKDIMDSYEAERSGVISRREKTKLGFNMNKIKEMGFFGGTHHYHPQSEAGNFSICFIDKYYDFNQTNLLTFNMPSGPEVIAYTKDDVFIPADKTKRYLVRAGFKDIMRYLSN